MITENCESLSSFFLLLFCGFLSTKRISKNVFENYFHFCNLHLEAGILVFVFLFLKPLYKTQLFYYLFFIILLCVWLLWSTMKYLPLLEWTYINISFRSRRWKGKFTKKKKSEKRNVLNEIPYLFNGTVVLNYKSNEKIFNSDSWKYHRCIYFIFLLYISHDKNQFFFLFKMWWEVKYEYGITSIFPVFLKRFRQFL